MKKFNRREKTIIRVMALVVTVALLSEVWEWYVTRRTAMEDTISSLSAQIDTIEKRLEGQDKQTYLTQAEEIEEELEDVRGMVLELPDETTASLLIRQTISELAEKHGIKVNSISSRKTQDVGDMKELRVYFGYDADLGSMANFFRSLEDEDYFLVVETLNISARRQARPRPNKNRKNRKNTKTRLSTRKPLNGNAVLTTLFKVNPEASPDRYRRDRSADSEDDDADDAAPKEDAPKKDAEETKASGLTPVEATPKPPKTSGEGDTGSLKRLGDRNPPPKVDPPKTEDKRPPLQPKPKPLTGKAKSKDKGQDGKKFDPKKRF